MSSKLATALKTVISERGLSDNLGKAAEQIGVAYPSLRAVLAGSSKPNKATRVKYREFLGLDDDDFTNLISGEATTPRKGRARKAAAAEDEPAADEAAEAEANEIEVAKPARATRSAGGDVDRAYAAIAELARDDLALRVHAASAGVRALIGKILG